jgi:CHAD domain-containing protein
MAASQPRYALLHTQISRLNRVLPGVAEGDVRAIHRARVASRRLREILPLLELDPDVTRKLNKRLRRITRSLGPVRELDVLRSLIDELHESRRPQSAALAHIAEVVTTARIEAREAISGKGSSAMRRATRKLERIAESLRDRDSGHRTRAWRWALEARMAHRAAALKRAIADAGAVYLPERLHTVRIAVKKLRYAVELDVESGASKFAADLATLKRLQRLLGRMHDLQVLIDWVRKAQANHLAGDPAATRDLDATAISLDRSCRRLHARYVRERDALLAVCERTGAAAARRRRNGLTQVAGPRPSERRAS